MAIPSADNHYLLALYQSAVSDDAERFEAHALARLGEILPFDSAWWVTSSVRDSHHQVHCSTSLNLPDDFVTCWQQTDDPVLRSCLPRPWHSQRFATAQFTHSRPARELRRLSGIRHVLTTLTPPPAGDAVFCGLSLYRHRDRPFTAREQQRKQDLMPHLLNARRINRQRQLDDFRAAQGRPCGVALIDSQGYAQAMEDACKDHLRLAWPHWQGGYLPPELWQALGANTPVMDHRLGMHSIRQGDLHLLATWPRVEAELSPRELQVARLFAEGLTYKAVARRLDMAPATARHHLRVIYAKLGVNGKVGLIDKLASARVTP